MTEQLDTILQTFGGETEQSFNVRMEEEVEQSIKSLLFDKEMDALRQAFIDDGDESFDRGRRRTTTWSIS